MISLTRPNTLTYTITVAFALVYYTPLKKTFLIVLSYRAQKKNVPNKRYLREKRPSKVQKFVRYSS